MSNLPDFGFPQTGETAESGTYICMNCPHDKPDDEAVVILYKRDKLPICPVCKSPTYWMVV